MRTSTSGRSSRFTAAQIAEIRAAWLIVRDARALQSSVVARLGLRRDEFNHYGQGVRGKKPAREAA